MAYAKLFATITESSLWSGSKEARLLFVSMLARADQVGYVEAAVPGLARMANLTVQETIQALDELMAPDEHSKSQNAEGRRVVKADRGWCLVNYEAYRERRDDESRREYMRAYMKKYRTKNNEKPVNTCKRSVNTVSRRKPPLAQAEAEAEAEGEGERATPPPPRNDSGEDERTQNRRALARMLCERRLASQGDALDEWVGLLRSAGCARLKGAGAFLAWAKAEAVRRGVAGRYAREYEGLIPAWQARCRDERERAKRAESDVARPSDTTTEPDPAAVRR